MAVRNVPVCAKCGEDIVPAGLGDRDGGPREIGHPATTWLIMLCSTCVKPIFDLFEPYVEEVRMTGTMTGLERLRYLPRADMNSAAPSVTDGAAG